MEPPINLLSLNSLSSFSPHRHSLTMLLTTYIFRNNGAILLLPCSFLPVSLLCFRPHLHQSRSVCVLINVPQRQTEMKKKNYMQNEYFFFTFIFCLCLDLSSPVFRSILLFRYRSAMPLCAFLPLLLDYAPSRPETTGIISILLPAASKSAQKEEGGKKLMQFYTNIWPIRPLLLLLCISYLELSISS